MHFAAQELAAVRHLSEIRSIHEQQMPFADIVSPTLLAKLQLRYEEKCKELGNMRPEEFIHFFTWLFRTWTSRYFLLESRHHYMAAIASQKGICEFFDPNGGIVQAPNAYALRSFLVAYLSNQKLRRHYGSQQRLDLIRLTAYKFK